MNLFILNFSIPKIFVVSLYVLLIILHHQTELSLFNLHDLTILILSKKCLFKEIKWEKKVTAF